MIAIVTYVHVALDPIAEIDLETPLLPDNYNSSEHCDALNSATVGLIRTLKRLNQDFATNKLYFNVGLHRQ